MSKPSIYISHAWGGESEKIVQKIVKKFSKEGIEITLDKKDLGYRESINDFMRSLGAADAIIIVVSNKYLHSEYCMFELLQIYENKDILHRIFPVVLDEVNIAKSTDRLDLVKYWETQSKELENKIRELDTISNIEGITEDLNLYKSIRNNIAHLTAILKDINTLNIKLHQDSDFNDLFQAVKRKIEVDPAGGAIENVAQTVPPDPIAVPKKPVSYATQPDSYRTTRKRRNWLPVWIGLLLLVPLAYFGINQWATKQSDLPEETSESQLVPQESEILTPPPQSTPDQTESASPQKMITDREPTKQSTVQDDKEQPEKMVNSAPPSKRTFPVKIYLDRKIRNAEILINDRPITDYNGDKTLNVITAELPEGNQHFRIRTSRDSCVLYQKIVSVGQEITLKCN